MIASSLWCTSTSSSWLSASWRRTASPCTISPRTSYIGKFLKLQVRFPFAPHLAQTEKNFWSPILQTRSVFLILWTNVYIHGLVRMTSSSHTTSWSDTTVSSAPHPFPTPSSFSTQITLIPFWTWPRIYQLILLKLRLFRIILASKSILILTGWSVSKSHRVNI